MPFRTTDLFDTIEDNNVQLQPCGVVNTERIKELTMRKVNAESSAPIKKRRPVGGYLLAAVLVTFLLATTVFAYVGFTLYENPGEMLEVFFGNDKLTSVEGGKIQVNSGGYTYEVNQPFIDRIPLDSTIPAELLPQIAAVGQSATWKGYTITVTAMLHEPILGSGVIYYTLENPNGITGYDVQYDGGIWWPGGEKWFWDNCSARDYLIAEESTDTKLSLVCYYHYAAAFQPEENAISLCLNESNQSIRLSLSGFVPKDNTVTFGSGEIVVSPVAIELQLEDIPFLYTKDTDGSTVPPVDAKDIQYLAIRYADGTKYIISQETDTVIHENYAYGSIWDDPVRGHLFAISFNRLVDTAKIDAVIINDTEFPVSN